MKKSILIVASAAALGACGTSAEDATTNQAAAKEAQPKKKPAYCFFKDAEMKGWAASRGKDGNITVKGKAFRSDARYQAVFKPAEVTGTTAEIAPTIQNNTTGYGAVDNWWDIKATIPNSAAIETVKVICGAKTVAELKVPAKA
jgi:hypothetical protein